MGAHLIRLIEKAKRAQARSDWESAEQALNLVLEKEPLHPEANYLLGCMALEAGYPEDALELARTAHRQTPSNRSFQKLKILCIEQLVKRCAQSGKWVELIEYATQLSQLHSHQAVAYGWLATAYMKLGRMDACRTEYGKRMAASQPDSLMYSQWVGLHAGDPATDEEAYYRLAQSWDERFHRDDCPPASAAANKSPLRVGFVSATLRNHANANFLLPLLKGLQAYPIEIHAYHDGRVCDEVTEQIRDLCAGFSSIAGRSLEAAAERIRADQLHLLVDINGHFDASRMALYTRRPAPTQIHYLGGTGALAMRSIDWRLADALTEPQENPDRPNDKIYRLTEGIHAFQPLTETAKPAPPPVVKNGYVTFGCCNGLHKIERPLLKLWARLLEAYPDSRLRLVKDIFAIQQNKDHFAEFLLEAGMPIDRIDLLPQHANCRFDDLSVYNTIDIALDTFPYNGITTTCEALWMGVPVVTLAGNRFVAREAASILTRAGHPEWVAENESQYRAICGQISTDLSRRSSARRELSQTFREGPICDGSRIAQSFFQCLTELRSSSSSS